MSMFYSKSRSRLRAAAVLAACLLAAGLPCLAGGCVAPARAPEPKPMSRQNFQLDTLITITIYDSDDQSIFQEVFDEIARLESLLSAAAPGSDPDRLALSAGQGYVEVSDDTILLLEEGARFSRLSGGAFDCTVGPLVSLWGIKDTGGHYPTEAELAEALSQIGYEGVLVKEGNLAMLKNAGMKADFGAVAKGYIADRVKELLAARGIQSAVLDLGGNIVLIGSKPDGSPFRIGARDPAGGAADYFGVFEAADISLVSSGSYERYFVHEGKAYHHILDVRTGFPADNELMQVTILSDKSVDGDGFSTTAFLLGLEGGLRLVGGTEGVEGVFVTKDKKVYATEGIGGAFTIVSDEYEFAR
ncbi:MAG: FAD:protein FMN transferase [Clostridiales bacterium]|nr:FAD:protein FMN transferase [Clostridiales bacterium]